MLAVRGEGQPHVQAFGRFVGDGLDDLVGGSFDDLERLGSLAVVADNEVLAIGGSGLIERKVTKGGELAGWGQQLADGSATGRTRKWSGLVAGRSCMSRGEGRDCGNNGTRRGEASTQSSGYVCVMRCTHNPELRK